MHAHYGFSVTYANPDSGHEKGNVERKVGWSRQHLFTPMPELDDIDASPYGPLFELAVLMSHDLHGYGSFATVYDDVVVVLPIAHPEAFDDGEPGTYRVI